MNPSQYWKTLVSTYRTCKGRARGLYHGMGKITPRKGGSAGFVACQRQKPFWRRLRQQYGGIFRKVLPATSILVMSTTYFAGRPLMSPPWRYERIFGRSKSRVCGRTYTLVLALLPAAMRYWWYFRQTYGGILEWARASNLGIPSRLQARRG